MAEIRKLAKLRRLKLSELTDAELAFLIEGCAMTEVFSGLPAKARRAWRAKRRAAEAEQKARAT